MMGRPGPCCISSSTGLDGSLPRIRIHCVTPSRLTASSESMFITVLLTVPCPRTTPTGVPPTPGRAHVGDVVPERRQPHRQRLVGVNVEPGQSPVDQAHE